MEDELHALALRKVAGLGVAAVQLRHQLDHVEAKAQVRSALEALRLFAQAHQRIEQPRSFSGPAGSSTRSARGSNRLRWPSA